jgi:hypothetical protein
VSLFSLCGKEIALQEDNMVARQTTSRNMQSISGISVLALGLFLLLANVDGVTAQISRAAGAPAEVLGVLPALFLAGLRGLQAYIFDHAGFLSSLMQILVSFWPLLLIAAGAILLRPLILGESGRKNYGAETLPRRFKETTNAR